MRPFLTWMVSGAAGLAAFAALGAIAPQTFVPAAHAFTIEGGDSGGQYEVPKFDLEEQMRQFRTDNSGTASSGKSQIETPFGKGTLEFGARQGTMSNFGSGFSGFGPGWGSSSQPLVTRQDFERMVTPENLR